MKGPLTRELALAAALIALGSAGCGSVPPAVPHTQAKALDSATGGIADACGRSYGVTEFPGDHHRYLAPLEVSAGRSARALAAVYAQNSGWLYRGETLGSVVEDGVSYLRQCGLPNAADLLVRLTGVG